MNILKFIDYRCIEPCTINSINGLLLFIFTFVLMCYDCIQYNIVLKADMNIHIELVFGFVFTYVSENVRIEVGIVDISTAYFYFNKHEQLSCRML